MCFSLFSALTFWKRKGCFYQTNQTSDPVSSSPQSVQGSPPHASLFVVYCRDGPDQSSPQIGQFSGNTALESVYSTSNIILIKFHSDFSGAGFFVLSYHGECPSNRQGLLCAQPPCRFALVKATQAGLSCPQLPQVCCFRCCLLFKPGQSLSLAALISCQLCWDWHETASFSLANLLYWHCR